MPILYCSTGDAPAAVGQSGFDDEKSPALLMGAECSLKTDSKRDRGGATSLLRHGFSYDRKKTYWVSYLRCLLGCGSVDFGSVPSAVRAVSALAEAYVRRASDEAPKWPGF